MRQLSIQVGRLAVNSSVPRVLVCGLLACGLFAVGCGRADRSAATPSNPKAPPVTPTSATLEEGLSETEVLVERGSRLVATDKAAAVELLSEAIRKDPTHERARSVRGMVLAELNRDDEAYEDSEYLREHRSLFAGPIASVLRLKSIQYVADGKKSLAAGDVDAALAKFQSAIKFHPEHAGGYAGRGRVFVVQGKLPEAEADLTRALQLDADSWMALLGRGELRMAQGDPTSALKDLNRAVQLAPNESNLYRVRSKALGLSGDATAADQDLKTASRIDAEK